MNQAEFEVVYREQWPLLVGQLVLLCGDRAEAADCVQEAFARGWQHRRSLEADAGGWLRTTAARIAVSRWRKRRSAAVAWSRWGARQLVAPTEVGPGLGVGSPLAAALQLLPVRQREVVVLHHVLDLTVAQVADLLGAPTGSVKVWLSRGRAQLARSISDPASRVVGTEERAS